MVTDPRNLNLAGKTETGNYIIKRVAYVDAIQAIFYEFQHIKTGAQHIHLSLDDDNNFFMETFRTLPGNSTGVAHILEHAVLEGSKNYPVKTYRHLTGRSLNTFLNAMTSADYTSYPFSSRNETDFFNLMDLYLDAAFLPLLQKEMFLQEGWRFEFERLDDPSTPLLYKGVVYNEMKGAMSNPLRLFHENWKKAIFPDLLYRFVSGGDPAFIPSLTYEDWVEFHRTHYHPSNSYFFTYGTFSIVKILNHIDSKMLSQFDYRNPPAPIPLQPCFSDPVRFRATYPIGLNENPERKTMISVVWKLLPITNFYENLHIWLLSIVLCGDNSSILNRKLLSSGLGGGLAPVGFEDSYSETCFGVGLKDSDESKITELESLVLGTMEELERNGFPVEDVDAALHQLEFSTREIKGDHGFPFGLSLVLRGIQSWTNGGDFLESLMIGQYLDKLREECRHPEFLPGLIRKYFLDNRHRATLILSPAPGGFEKQDQILKEKLASIKSRFTDEEILAIVEQSRILLQHQDLEEDTSCLPKISIKDISPNPDFTPQIHASINGIPVFRHPVMTNGISYMVLAFDHASSHFSPETAASLIRMIPDLGAGGRSYIETSRLINLVSGGINLRFYPYRNVDDQSTHISAVFSMKCLPRNHQSALNIAADLLLRMDSDDIARFLELINIQKAYVVPMATYEAHRFAMLAAGRHLSHLKFLQHHLDGFGFVQRMIQMQPQDAEYQLKAMGNLVKKYADKSHLKIGLTTSENDMDDLSAYLPGFIDQFSEGRFSSPPTADMTVEGDQLLEAWIVNTEVSYVAQAVPVVSYEHPDSPVLQVLSQLLEMPLYDLIRAKGGAYGAYASYDMDSAIFNLATYRDPHTAQSFSGFQQIIEEIGSGKYTNERLSESIVETIRQSDIPPSPREKGLNALFHFLTGRSIERRRKHRHGILSVQRGDIDRVLNHYFSKGELVRRAIVTSDDILKRTEAAGLRYERISLIK